jgi:oligopeptidase B
VHPRGSMAKGYQWYLDGKLVKKTNTFKDFIAAGHFLVDNGYSAPDKVVAMGGSAGGLLMGAVANMDPETVRRHDRSSAVRGRDQHHV